MPKLRIAGLLAGLLLLCSCVTFPAVTPNREGSLPQRESLEESSQALPEGPEVNIYWGDEPEDTQPGEGVLPTEEDLAQLEELLAAFWSISGTEFDFEHTDAKQVMDLIVVGFAAPGYSPYFGRLEPVYEEGGSDPRGRFARESGSTDGTASQTSYYYKIPADNMDWIVANIFHTLPDRSIDTEQLYYEDGYYYRAAGDAGYIGHEVEVRYWEPLPDGRYYIACDYYVGPDREQSVHYMVADLQEVDGVPQWTFYNFSNQYMNFSTGSLIYDLLPGSTWVVSGTVRQGGDFGTEYYVELDRTLSVYLELEQAMIRGVGVVPYSNEYYASDFGSMIGQSVTVRGEVFFVDADQGLVGLESAFVYAA